MNTRTAAIALLAAGTIALTACSSSTDDSDPKPTPTATPSANYSSAEAAAGIPPEPTGAKRAALLAALKAVDPSLVADEDDAIDNARNQCSTISGGGNATLTAKGRFSTPEHEVTDAEAQAINAAVKATLC
jgi:hypothetical protein